MYQKTYTLDLQKRANFTHSLLHKLGQSQVYYKPVVGLVDLTLDDNIEQHLSFKIKLVGLNVAK